MLFARRYRSRSKLKLVKSFLTTTPEGMLVGGFASLILIGTILLWLPFAHGGKVGLIEALFTATSAVCVTGLIVVDTAKDFNMFGQLVILLLIQLGGLGLMTYAAVGMQLFGRRLSLAGRQALEDSFTQSSLEVDTRKVFRSILRLTLTIEAVGAGLLFMALIPEHSFGHSLFSAVFHSISAFCNAGFSIYSDSLISLRGNNLAMTVIMLLIIFGGIGHVVLYEIYENWHRRRRARPGELPPRLSLHTQIVLKTTVVLLAFGFFGLLLLGLTDGLNGWWSQVCAAAFQSVTARTAGFNTVDMAGLPNASFMIMMMLMFVGGSPGSCAGGVKTTSLAVWFSWLSSRLAGSSDVRVGNRRLSEELVSRTRVLIGLAAAWNLVGILFLLATEHAIGPEHMRDVIFEQISAFATVGLSSGITSSLSTLGRLWIILSMFVGRLGPLTMAYCVFGKKRELYRYPEGKVMIG